MECITFIGMGIIAAIMVSYFIGFWRGGKYTLRKMRETLPRKN